MEKNLLQEGTPLILSGILAYIVYFICHLRRQGLRKLDLAVTVAVITAGASVFGGFRVVMLSFDHEACKANLIEQIYIFLGGLCVVWAAVQDIAERISKIQVKTSEPDSE